MCEHISLVLKDARKIVIQERIHRKKFGRMVGCGLERPKQAPATMLPDRNSVTREHNVLARLSLLPAPPHLSSYQVSFSYLHCFLKMDWNISDILYMP
jgi:hypothetical protein